MTPFFILRSGRAVHDVEETELPSIRRGCLGYDDFPGPGSSAPLNRAAINNLLWNTTKHHLRLRFTRCNCLQRFRVKLDYFLYPVVELRLRDGCLKISIFNRFPPGIAKDQITLEWCFLVESRKMRIQERLTAVVGEHSFACLKPRLCVCDHRRRSDNSNDRAAGRWAGLPYQGVGAV